MRTPDKILEDFDAGASRGASGDVDMHAVLHEVIADITNAYALAMSAHVPAAVVDAIQCEVHNYVANNYGDD